MDYKYADRLIELRKKNNFSQDELAAKVGVSRQAISNWERGESLPDTENLIALSKIYGVSIDYILGLNTKTGRTYKDIEMELDEEFNCEDCGDSSDEADDEQESSQKKRNRGKDYVHVGFDGIFVKDSKTGDEVSIDRNGIFVNDSGGKHTFSRSTVRQAKDDWWYKAYGKGKLLRSIFDPIVFALSLIAYVIVGILYTQDNYVGWRTGWLILLLGIFIASILEACIKKRFSVVAIPILATIAFFCLGFFGGLWHPGWAVFLIIPLFYSIVCPIENYFVRKRLGIHID